MRSIALGLVLLVHSCEPREEVWVEQLVSKLQCGMSVAEVRALASRQVEATSNKPELGTHRMDGQWHDVWLTFRLDRLESVISGKIDGLASVRLSPMQNLCTGELTFFLSLEWVAPLEGADVFLDGRAVAENASSGVILEISAGDHELRIFKEGYKPIVKQLSLGSEDQGRTDILITTTDLQPVSI